MRARAEPAWTLSRRSGAPTRSTARAVGAAEQHRVHEQRQQLVELDALAPALAPAARAPHTPRTAAARARRTAAASPGRPRGARRRRTGRSATGARRASASTLPDHRSPCSRDGGSARARHSSPIRSHTRSTARSPLATARHARARAAPAAAGGAPRRTRGQSAVGSFESTSEPNRAGPPSSRSTSAPAACVAARPRPSSSAPASLEAARRARLPLRDDATHSSAR